MRNVLSLFSLIAVMAVFTAASISYGPTPGLKVGDKAPNFSLKNIDGSTYSLDDCKHCKGYIVTFTCNTCPYAKMYEERLNQLHGKYADLGYPVVAINPNDPDVKPDDSYEAMKAYSKEKKFIFPYLVDEGQKVFPQYGATKTPHVFLLDKNLIVRYIGAIDDNAQDASAVTKRYVEDAIESLRKGEEPPVTSTKAIGCSIKTKPGFSSN